MYNCILYNSSLGRFQTASPPVGDRQLCELIFFHNLWTESQPDKQVNGRMLKSKWNQHA